MAVPYKLSDALFAQRIWIVGPEHHAIGSHCVDKEVQSALIEHRRINIEALDILAWRMLALATRNWVIEPGVFHASEQERKASPTMGEADSQRSGQRIEGAAKDHGGDGELRFGGHADCPR